MKVLSNQKGSTVLEFTLVFPVFMALIIGLINLAVLFNNDLVAGLAARDAGRVTVGTGSAAAGRAAGLKTLETGRLAGGSATVRVDQPGPGVENVRAETVYSVPVLAPGFAALLGGKPWEDYLEIKKAIIYRVGKRLQEPENTEPHCGGWYGCR